MDQTQQAGAYLPCSPNLSSYSSLSSNIQLLINSKKKVSSVGALSITTNKPVFSHYEWASGMKKWERLDPDYAKDLLDKPCFQKNHLKTIWVPRKAPMHVDSIELQKIFGKTKVSAYGFF